jgi:hypothetical protein
MCLGHERHVCPRPKLSVDLKDDQADVTGSQSAIVTAAASLLGVSLWYWRGVDTEDQRRPSTDLVDAECFWRHFGPGPRM